MYQWAYTITTSTEENLMQLQVTQQRIEGNNLAVAVTEQRMEEVQ